MKKYVVLELPQIKNLENIFNNLFQFSERTVLISGGEEPIYIPASETNCVNTIISTKDYFSSALHEISHWCVAGTERRALEDYGYWYEPDGRTEDQQRLFEKAEIKPQALEWLFTAAAGQKFRLSIDNVNQPEMQASDDFRQSVYLQTLCYLEKGLSDRPQRFMDALLRHFQPDESSLQAKDFKLELLK